MKGQEPLVVKGGGAGPSWDSRSSSSSVFCCLLMLKNGLCMETASLASAITNGPGDFCVCVVVIFCFFLNLIPRFVLFFSQQ